MLTEGVHTVPAIFRFFILKIIISSYLAWMKVWVLVILSQFLTSLMWAEGNQSKVLVFYLLFYFYFFKVMFSVGPRSEALLQGRMDTVRVSSYSYSGEQNAYSSDFYFLHDTDFWEQLARSELLFIFFSLRRISRYLIFIHYGNHKMPIFLFALLKFQVVKTFS